MVALSEIEVEIREPTGLSLGTFDLMMVRQKIYQGELPARCEFKDSNGNWIPLINRKDFADIFWLLGEAVQHKPSQRRSKFAGWKTTSEDSSVRRSKQVDLGRPTKKLSGLRALTSRFRTNRLPKLPEEPPDDK